MDNLGRAVKRGVAWIVAGRGIKLAVNAGASVALARLLDPHTFGLFAIATLFIGFTKQLQTFGMAKAAIRLKEIRQDHLSTVFTVNALSSTTLCAAMWAAAPLLDTIFGEPTAVPVLQLLALGFLVNPFSSVATAILERRMDFKSKSRANVYFSLSKVGTSVVLAGYGWDVWSLVIGHLVGQVVRAAILIVSARWLPSLRVSRAALGDLAGFGVGMFFKNAALYVQERVDYLIVGRWLGASALGFYERAYRMPDAVVKELGKATSAVLFSAYSKIGTDRERLRRAFTKVLVSVCLLAYPGLAGVALIAPALIPLVFGAKWEPTVVPMQILCIAGFFRLFTQLSTTMMNALGFIRAEAAWRMAAVVVLAAACWYATAWGVVGVAVAIVAVEALISIVLSTISLRVSGLGARDVLAPQAPILASTALLLGATAAFQKAAGTALGSRSWAMLGCSVAIGGIAYASSLYLWGNEPVRNSVREILGEIRALLSRGPAAGKGRA